MRLKYIFWFLFIPLVGYSQPNGNLVKNHKLTLSFYDLIKLPGNDAFFNDNWMFATKVSDKINRELHYRNSTRFALGLSYEYQLKNNFSIGLDFGMGFRQIKEGLVAEDKPDDFSEENFHTDLMYKQLNYAINIIGYKSFYIKNLRISLGLGPSYWQQGKGNQILEGKGYSLFIHPYQNYYSKSYGNLLATTTIGAGHNIGLGTWFGLDYHFSPLFAIGLDINWFVYYSIYNASITDYMTETSVIWQSDMGIIFDETTELYRETNLRFRQFSFSNISPRLKISFLF